MTSRGASSRAYRARTHERDGATLRSVDTAISDRHVHARAELQQGEPTARESNVTRDAPRGGGIVSFRVTVARH